MRIGQTTCLVLQIRTGKTCPFGRGRRRCPRRGARGSHYFSSLPDPGGVLSTLTKIPKRCLIQITLKAPVFSYCSMTVRGKGFTLYGASQRDTLHPPS